MYYLQLALLALAAILLSYNFIIAVLCLTIFLIIVLKNKNLNARKTIFCLIVFLAFFIRGMHIQKTNVSHLSNIEEAHVILEVNDRVTINGNYMRGVAKLNKEKILFNYVLKNEEEKEYFKEKFSGGRIFVVGNIVNITEKRNFYSFDYKKYNENKRIFKQVKINNIEKIEKNKTLISKIKSLRGAISAKINKNISFDKSGYIEALLFGDKSYLQNDEINNYKNLGTSHLLAISGLHIGVLIGLVYFILKKLKISIETIDKLIFIILSIYMFISGLSPSVLRAGGMIMFYVLFRKKDLSRLSALLLTFMLLLMINPLFIFDIGFELSFFITFSLLMSNSYLKRAKNNVHSYFRISLISSLASFPILIANFYTFSYISVVSNIVLVPIFSLIIFPLVILSYIVFLFSSSSFNFFCRPLLNFAFYIFDKMQDIFLIFRPIIIGKHNIYIDVLYFILTLLLIIYLNKNNFKFIFYYSAALILMICGSKLNYIDYFEEIKIGKSNIYYASEGRKNLLINTSNNVDNFYTDFRKKDTEYDIINEYTLLFNYVGKRKINYLLLTSEKNSKIGYAKELIGKGLVENVIVIDHMEKNLKEIVDLAKFKHVKINILKQNNRFNLENIKVYYNKNEVKVKNKEKEFKIEVDS
ncbi:ComEC/Rec2 family competence protein [Gemella cuniculi]|uniref:ComEC/Rec2 family competence protein n=1 Tax=Gemella cuniculi TaxID=150240 RepID=UPI0004198B8E|nr:ComEC/Rec2 family competence protein [Gemella cuniculi]